MASEQTQNPSFAINNPDNAGLTNVLAPDPGLTTATNSSRAARAASNGNIEVVTPNEEIVQNRMVFSTVKEEVRAPKTLTLRNTGSGPLTITGLRFGDSQEKDNAVLLADHQRAADFRIVNNMKLPITLQPNESRNLLVQFAPKRVATLNVNDNPTHLKNGENYASLTITSNDPDQPTMKVNLAGLNSGRYEGTPEPSLAEIVRTFGWTVNIGTEDNILGGSKTLIGDEVYSPYWLPADTSKPVELWQLAEYSQRTDTPHGSIAFEAKPGSGGNRGLIYQLAGPNEDDSPKGNEVLGSNDLSGGENQKVLPKNYVNNVNSVPTTDTVSFTPQTAFALRSYGSWTDDSQNGPDQVHNWRIFTVRDALGNVVPNTWIAAMDPGLDPDPATGKNFDYNDRVYLLKNAKPESATDPSVGGLFPGSPDLVFDFNGTDTRGLTDKDGQKIGFTGTQLNKNDSFVTTTRESYDPSRIDIDTSGLGTLKVTTTTGSNGSNDNTLVNGLRTTFDGRASKANISTRLVGPLNNITTGVQQGGVMFGPDQDNYIKLVAIARKGGNVGLQFYFEDNGVGKTIGPVVPISNPETVQSLDLMLLTNPRAGTVQAAYRIVSSTGDTGIVTLPNSVLLKGGEIGHFFDPRSKAGIITTHKGSTTPIALTFDQFAITSNETTAARTALYRLDVGSNSNYTDTFGNVWTPDDGLFTPSTAIDENGGPTNPAPPIANTRDDKLYQTYRGFTGSFSTPQESRVVRYNLPVTPGKVDLRLHFAELNWGAPGRGPAGPGQRIFDIKAEGVTLLNNLDITAASGGALTALVVPIEGIQVNDGVLNLEFKAEKDFANIAAIGVYRSPSRGLND